MCERRCCTPIHLNPVLRQTNGTGRFTQGNGAELMGDERPLVPESALPCVYERFGSQTRFTPVSQCEHVHECITAVFSFARLTTTH